MPITESRVRAVLPWLAEKKHLWLALGVVGIALIISLRPGTREPVIRLTGLALQLLGVLTVIWGIATTRALFGHPPFFISLKAWLKRFPLAHQNFTLDARATSYGTAMGKARAYVTHGPTGPNPTTTERLDILEKNIQSIHERISANEKEVDEEFRKATESLKSESEERQKTDKILQERLEATGTGGVHISAIGAVWLFVGVILSTAGLEIAKLLE